MNSIHKGVIAQFKALYGSEPEAVIRAPGRINLIGEHTDYNQGLVLPAAIDKSIYFAVKRNDLRKCRFYALDVDQSAEVTLPVTTKTGKLWAQYIQGACKVLEDKGYRVLGFDCVFGGDIPIGSGLSSSAALDCGMISAISLLSDIPLDRWGIVEVSNISNNTFLGIQSGILDQFASVFGASGSCMSLDCRTKNFLHHQVDFGSYELILINSNVKHDHSDSGYNDRPAECKRAIEQLNRLGLQIDSLRDLSMDDLLLLRSKLDPILFSRAKYLIEENQRVLEFIKALERQDIFQLGQLLYASHEGLQHLYEVSCPELDLLVDLTRPEEGVAGSRMMGGGFGGCTLNLIKSTEADRVLERITSSYKTQTSIDASVYKVRISNGLEIIANNKA